jgi:hypothetical protein
MNNNVTSPPMMIIFFNGLREEPPRRFPEEEERVPLGLGRGEYFWRDENMVVVAVGEWEFVRVRGLGINGWVEVYADEV